MRYHITLTARGKPTLVPFAGINLIRFHGSRITTAVSAKRHSDKSLKYKAVPRRNKCLTVITSTHGKKREMDCDGRMQGDRIGIAQIKPQKAKIRGGNHSEAGIQTIKKPALLLAFLSGRGGGTRTPNIRFWRPTLYQLNYAPKALLLRLAS